MYAICSTSLIFFFNDTATTEIYTLSLHDALPISRATRMPCRALSPCGPRPAGALRVVCGLLPATGRPPEDWLQDRKSTRLNSSHANISYAVFCLKKKKLHLVRSTDEVKS